MKDFVESIFGGRSGKIKDSDIYAHAANGGRVSSPRNTSKINGSRRHVDPWELEDIEFLTQDEQKKLVLELTKNISNRLGDAHERAIRRNPLGQIVRDKSYDGVSDKMPNLGVAYNTYGLEENITTFMLKSLFEHLAEYYKDMKSKVFKKPGVYAKAIGSILDEYFLEEKSEPGLFYDFDTNALEVSEILFKLVKKFPFLISFEEVSKRKMLAENSCLQSSELEYLEPTPVNNDLQKIEPVPENSGKDLFKNNLELLLSNGQENSGNNNQAPIGEPKPSGLFQETGRPDRAVPSRVGFGGDVLAELYGKGFFGKISSEEEEVVAITTMQSNNS